MSTPIPVSTAPAARRWLFEQFTAQIAPDPDNARASLLICYDVPGPNEPEDIIAVGLVTRTLDVNSVVGGGGKGWLDERYSIAVTIDCFRGGDDPAAVFDRASTLLDQTCAIVRTDPTLGGAVLVARPTTSQTEGEWDSDNLGRHTVVTFAVECYARI
ncbi:hypothetical protein RVR_10574 [Actinacidiphila reveromycinica]|uniref:Uncharacterized protein n=1 Tax=Actinacidiphila reveromycinica TaxID=659352 RepID=A0A7U3UXM1_9ACTN|nr:hypothetical protein [Streptomyces sp. SN-593]BBB00575.1 hypothetical protein RVR_7707 [Streptomyces sp. SN-593]BBB00628.1 hypothetical protein RVR_10574 [Streptomyces sp. SN-593]